MSAATFAERLMLADVERVLDAHPQDLSLLFSMWKEQTTTEFVLAIRFPTPFEHLNPTVDDLACAIDALDSLRRAREWELHDALTNGSHWLGGRCEGCGTR